MSDPKYSGTGADWTQLLTDPALVSHLGELLQVYRDTPAERRDQALLEAMRNIKGGTGTVVSAAKAAAAAAQAQPAAIAQTAPPPPVATSPAATPPFEPDIFTPTWGQDRRRHARLRCFVAVELRLGDSGVPIWGNLSNTSIGGCFVETATPVPSGVSVEIGLWLANGKIWIKGTHPHRDCHQKQSLLRRAHQVFRTRSHRTGKPAALSQVCRKHDQGLQQRA